MEEELPKGTVARIHFPAGYSRDPAVYLASIPLFSFVNSDDPDLSNILEKFLDQEWEKAYEKTASRSSGELDGKTKQKIESQIIDRWREYFGISKRDGVYTLFISDSELSEDEKQYLKSLSEQDPPLVKRIGDRGYEINLNRLPNKNEEALIRIVKRTIRWRVGSALYVDFAKPEKEGYDVPTSGSELHSYADFNKKMKLSDGSEVHYEVISTSAGHVIVEGLIKVTVGDESRWFYFYFPLSSLKKTVYRSDEEVESDLKEILKTFVKKLKEKDPDWKNGAELLYYIAACVHEFFPEFSITQYADCLLAYFVYFREWPIGVDLGISVEIIAHEYFHEGTSLSKEDVVQYLDGKKHLNPLKEEKSMDNYPEAMLGLQNNPLFSKWKKIAKELFTSGVAVPRQLFSLEVIKDKKGRCIGLAGHVHPYPGKADQRLHFLVTNDAVYWFYMDGIVPNVEKKEIGKEGWELLLRVMYSYLLFCNPKEEGVSLKEVLDRLEKDGLISKETRKRLEEEFKRHGISLYTRFHVFEKNSSIEAIKAYLQSQTRVERLTY